MASRGGPGKRRGSPRGGGGFMMMPKRGRGMMGGPRGMGRPRGRGGMMPRGGMMGGPAQAYGGQAYNMGADMYGFDDQGFGQAQDPYAGIGVGGGLGVGGDLGAGGGLGVGGGQVDDSSFTKDMDFTSDDFAFGTESTTSAEGAGPSEREKMLETQLAMEREKRQIQQEKAKLEEREKKIQQFEMGGDVKMGSSNGTEASSGGGGQGVKNLMELAALGPAMGRGGGGMMGRGGMRGMMMGRGGMAGRGMMARGGMTMGRGGMARPGAAAAAAQPKGPFSQGKETTYTGSMKIINNLIAKGLIPSHEEIASRGVPQEAKYMALRNEVCRMVDSLPPDVKPESIYDRIPGCCNKHGLQCTLVYSRKPDFVMKVDIYIGRVCLASAEDHKKPEAIRKALSKSLYTLRIRPIKQLMANTSLKKGWKVNMDEFDHFECGELFSKDTNKHVLEGKTKLFDSLIVYQHGVHAGSKIVDIMKTANMNKLLVERTLKYADGIFTYAIFIDKVMGWQVKSPSKMKAEAMCCQKLLEFWRLTNPCLEYKPSGSIDKKKEKKVLTIQDVFGEDNPAHSFDDATTERLANILEEFQASDTVQELEIPAEFKRPEMAKILEVVRPIPTLASHLKWTTENDKQLFVVSISHEKDYKKILENILLGDPDSEYKDFSLLMPALDRQQSCIKNLQKMTAEKFKPKVSRGAQPKATFMGDMVLFVQQGEAEDAQKMLERSVEYTNISLEYRSKLIQYEEKPTDYLTEVVLADIVVAYAMGPSVLRARKKACGKAVKSLKKIMYTIKSRKPIEAMNQEELKDLPKPTELREIYSNKVPADATKRSFTPTAKRLLTRALSMLSHTSEELLFTDDLNEIELKELNDIAFNSCCVIKSKGIKIGEDTKKYIWAEKESSVQDLLDELKKSGNCERFDLEEPLLETAIAEGTTGVKDIETFKVEGGEERQTEPPRKPRDMILYSSLGQDKLANILTKPYTYLNNSAKFSCMDAEYILKEAKFVTGPVFLCDLLIEGQLMGQGKGLTKADARSHASCIALTQLKNTNYTMVRKVENAFLDSASPDLPGQGASLIKVQDLFGSLSSPTRFKKDFTVAKSQLDTLLENSAMEQWWCDTDFTKDEVEMITKCATAKKLKVSTHPVTTKLKASVSMTIISKDISSYELLALLKKEKKGGYSLLPPGSLKFSEEN